MRAIWYSYSAISMLIAVVSFALTFAVPGLLFLLVSGIAFGNCALAYIAGKTS